MVMDLAASAIMAVEVLEDNLPKPLMLSGNFHYVCVLLSMVEINVVVVPPHPPPLFLKFDKFLIMIKEKVYITFFLEEKLKGVLFSALMGSCVQYKLVINSCDA